VELKKALKTPKTGYPRL